MAISHSLGQWHTTRERGYIAASRFSAALGSPVPEFSMYLNAIAEVLRGSLERQKTGRVVKGDAVTM